MKKIKTLFEFYLPHTSDQQTDERRIPEDRRPRRREQHHGVVAGVVGAFVGRHMQHRRPHDRPDEPEHGQHEETTLVRHHWYGQAAEHVAEKSPEHRAGEHERRVQASLRLGYDLPRHGTAARARRAERAPG